jgi:peptidoglycan/LPS O-acetylase OafA/YrhL
MSASAAPRPHFVRGLDSFRFIAAAVVAAGHGALVPFDRIAGETHGIWKMIGGAWDSLPNGTLAVCVFFFISGFCIHFPNVIKERVPVVPFLIKRGLRIGIPLFVTLAAAYAFGRQYVSALDSVLWSVYCELVYYALYPVLFPVLRGRWVSATIVCAAVSIGLLIAFPDTPRPWNFGVVTFLFCAPMWLLGAVLAERYRSGALFTDRLPPVWFLRAALPSCAILATFMFYHAPIKIPLTWSVAAFVPVGYLWLAKELQRLTTHRTSDRLETLGLAAYSIYLVHRFPLTFFNDHFGPNLPIAVYVLQAVAIGLVAYVFYRCIEKPSHELSKAVGRRLSDSRTAAKPDSSG